MILRYSKFVQHLALIAFLFVPALSNYAQSPVELQKEEIQVGENVKSAKKVFAQAYTLPDKIINYHVDSVSSTIWIETRKMRSNGSWTSKGILYVFDREMRPKWQKSIKYAYGGMSYFDNWVMHKVNSDYYVLDPETGKSMYKFNRELQYVVPHLNLGLGYLAGTTTPNILEGFDLISGRTKWRREIPRDVIWNEVVEDSDTTLLISSQGLHSVNLKTGLGWSYDEVSVLRQRNPEFAIGAVAGIALGLFTGVFIIPVPYGQKDVPKNNSTLLIDENGYYFTSRKRLTLLNKEGKKIWSVSMNEELTENTQLFKLQENIVLLHYNLNPAESNFGELQRSFIAAYDSKTGATNYSIFPKTTVSGMVMKDFKLTGFYLDMLYNNKIETYDLRSGEKVFSRLLDDVESEYYIGEDVYILNDAIWNPLIIVNPDSKYIYTSPEGIFQYSNTYLKQHVYESDEYAVLLYDFEDGCIIQNTNETNILNKNNTEVARLHFHNNLSVINHLLFFFDQDKFFISDINELLSD